MQFGRFNNTYAIFALALFTVPGCMANASATNPPVPSSAPTKAPSPLTVQLPVANIGGQSVIFDTDKVTLFGLVDSRGLQDAHLYDLKVSGSVEGDRIFLSADAVKSNRDPNETTSFSPGFEAVIVGVKVGTYRVISKLNSTELGTIDVKAQP